MSNPVSLLIISVDYRQEGYKSKEAHQLGEYWFHEQANSHNKHWRKWLTVPEDTSTKGLTGYLRFHSNSMAIEWAWKVFERMMMYAKLISQWQEVVEDNFPVLVACHETKIPLKIHQRCCSPHQMIPDWMLVSLNNASQGPSSNPSSLSS